jgi:hypothetical protein
MRHFYPRLKSAPLIGRGFLPEPSVRTLVHRDGTVRCPHCPIPEGLACRGINVRRFCELLNPQSRHYNAAYTDVLWKETNRLASKSTVLPQSQLASSTSPAFIFRGGTCCGGT